MQLRNRTYDSSLVVTSVRKNRKSPVELAKRYARKQIKIRSEQKVKYYKQYFAKKSTPPPFRPEFIKEMDAFLKEFHEKDTSTMKGKMDTIVPIKMMYTYLNNEQLYIFQYSNDYTQLIKVATETARRLESQMDNIYEEATQKRLTRSTIKINNQLKTNIEEAKKELHKWCEYANSY
jgi:predicted restriction endonuclease